MAEKITADTVYVRCKVINTDNQKLVPMLSWYGQEEEHMVWIASEQMPEYVTPMLNLPEGNYKLEYRLYQDERGCLSYKIKPPMIHRTVGIQLSKTETKVIEISDE